MPNIRAQLAYHLPHYTDLLVYIAAYKHIPVEDIIDTLRLGYGEDNAPLSVPTCSAPVVWAKCFGTPVIQYPSQTKDDVTAHYAASIAAARNDISAALNAMLHDLNDIVPSDADSQVRESLYQIERLRHVKYTNRSAADIQLSIARSPSVRLMKPPALVREPLPRVSPLTVLPRFSFHPFPPHHPRFADWQRRRQAALLPPALMHVRYVPSTSQQFSEGDLLLVEQHAGIYRTDSPS
jgi:hypothetical protein